MRQCEHGLSGFVGMPVSRRQLFAPPKSLRWMKMKTPTDEIREIRHKLSAKFDNDLDRICEDLMRQQRESGLKYVTLPRRLPEGYQASIPPAGGSTDIPNQSLPTTPPTR